MYKLHQTMANKTYDTLTLDREVYEKPDLTKETLIHIIITMLYSLVVLPPLIYFLRCIIKYFHKKKIIDDSFAEDMMEVCEEIKDIELKKYKVQLA